MFYTLNSEVGEGRNGDEVRYCLTGRRRFQDHHVCPPEAQPSADGFCQRQEECEVCGTVAVGAMEREEEEEEEASDSGSYTFVSGDPGLFLGI